MDECQPLGGGGGGGGADPAKELRDIVAEAGAYTVHVSAQLKRCLWYRGHIRGLFRECLEGVGGIRGCLGCILCQKRLMLS